jgi:hypothetical protein
MYQFDVNRIVGVKLYPIREAGYTWLPEKQRPSRFFGLIKKAPYPAGFYPGGEYNDGTWDNKPRSEEYIIENGYVIGAGKVVFRKACVTVYLESEYQVSQQFITTKEAEAWIAELIALNSNHFEIIK